MKLLIALLYVKEAGTLKLDIEFSMVLNPLSASVALI